MLTVTMTTTLPGHAKAIRLFCTEHTIGFSADRTCRKRFGVCFPASRCMGANDKKPGKITVSGLPNLSW